MLSLKRAGVAMFLTAALVAPQAATARSTHTAIVIFSPRGFGGLRHDLVATTVSGSCWEHSLLSSVLTIAALVGQNPPSPAPPITPTPSPTPSCIYSFFVVNAGKHTVVDMEIRAVTIQGSSTSGGWSARFLPIRELPPGASVRPFVEGVAQLENASPSTSTYEITVWYSDGTIEKAVVDICKYDLYLHY